MTQTNCPLISESEFKNLMLDVANIAGTNNVHLKVLRNYETLPESLATGDIDIHCRPSERLMWRKVFKEIAAKDHYDVSMVWTSYYVDKYSVKMMSGREVEFDINYCLEWYNVNFGNVITSQAISYNPQIMVYPRPTCLFIAFCHNFLYGGKIPVRYAKKYKDVISSDDFTKLMSGIFGRYSCRLIFLLNQNKSISRSEARKIRIYVMLRSVKKYYGLNIGKIIIRYFWGERYVDINMDHQKKI